MCATLFLGAPHSLSFVPRHVSQPCFHFRLLILRQISVLAQPISQNLFGHAAGPQDDDLVPAFLDVIANALDKMRDATV
jgi:hypothetical protein